MKTLLHSTYFALIITASGEPQPIEGNRILTDNTQFAFFSQPSGNSTPTLVGAFDPKTNKRIWKISLGMTSAYKVAGSKSGKFLAVLVGDQRKDAELQATAGSGNTIYILNGSTGKTVVVIDPLKTNANAPWAHPTWMDLNMDITDSHLKVFGALFSHPEHTKPIPYSDTFPLVEAPAAPVGPPPAHGLDWDK